MTKNTFDTTNFHATLLKPMATEAQQSSTIAIPFPVEKKIARAFPEESLDEYEHPDRIKASFERSVRDFRAG